jgi:TolB protein
MKLAATVAVALIASLAGPIAGAGASGTVWGQNGKIVFTSNRGPGMSPDADIFTMNADGSQQQRVRQNDFYDSDAVWSPDQSRILFDSHPTSSSEDIFTMKPGGNDLTDLTQNPAEDFTPDYSPTGKRIVFVSDRAAVYGLYVMDANGSHQHQLGPTLINGFVPRWSPSGKWIYFQDSSGGDNEIARIHPDGTGFKDLTNNDTGDNAPAPSLDGKRIAFERDVGPDSDAEIFVMNADGSHQHRLTHHVGFDSEPGWSPNGNRIIFEREDPSWTNSELFVMDADGSHVHRLTDNSFPDYFLD